jgi:molecular chaperone IbpA
MTSIDLSPLTRTLVGFDRLAGMMDQAQRLDGAQTYPPFNIEKLDENAFRIELAVAGFAISDLDIEVKENLLTVTGKRGGDSDQERRFLHRGIAERSFIRRFQLADYVIVTSAHLENGLLAIDLVRELPEAMKPRRVEIASTRSQTVLEAKPTKKSAA